MEGGVTMTDKEVQELIAGKDSRLRYDLFEAWLKENHVTADLAQAAAELLGISPEEWGE